MPLYSKLVGSNETLVMLAGDPSSAAAIASTLTVIDARSLSGLYAAVGQNAGLLLNPKVANRFELARQNHGSQGIAAVATEGQKLSYSNAIGAFTPVATATDFWQLAGSATNDVRLLKVRVTGFATAAASNLVQLVKRSTANSGGTPTTPAIVPHDSNDASATAVVTHFAANPTLGTLVGIAGAQYLNLGAAGGAGEVLWDFSTRNAKAEVLRGVAQSYCLNWNGAAVPAGTVLAIETEWTEEAIT